MSTGYPDRIGGGTRARVPSVRDWLALTKPRALVLVLASAGVGLWLGSGGQLAGSRWWGTLAGVAAAGGGCIALNQVLERERDRRMPRTCRRPLPAGRLTVRQAAAFGSGLVVAGCGLLWAIASPLAMWLTVATVASYLGVYTPLKPRTPLCTLVGAVPGALPPLIGWASAQGSLDATAWILFGVLYLWQLPHSLSIAWLYRDDYAQGGFRVLPVVDAGGGSTARQVLLASLALVPVSLVPTALGRAGSIYFLGALGLGVGLVAAGAWWAVGRSAQGARRLLHASVVYLSLLMGLLIMDAVP